MKNWLQSLFLFSPCFVWLLAVNLLGPDFALPNRLILAILCCAAGAGALLTNRKPPGMMTLAAGILMLASVPFSHDLPLENYDFQPRKALTAILSAPSPSTTPTFVLEKPERMP